MPKALLYGVPYELFWHLNPAKLMPFRKAYEDRMEAEEKARWISGLYVMRAVSACFGDEYPEQPLFILSDAKEANEHEKKDGYTQEEIEHEKEALVMRLQILEGCNQRAKAREEREKQQQESDSE